jgi:phosphoglucomutase
MGIHTLAGQAAPQEILTDIPHLVASYYKQEPDVESSDQLVAFGTSGHRGTSLNGSFNEQHIWAICQALCEYRQEKNISGPLFLGKDTHALSEPALISALEVFAAQGVEVRIQQGGGYTPTPVISHAILSYNKG